ncbi:hypothetical protein [Chlorobium ferrooxidans]|uniref:hypothetical protein n=1 Tax=Chlorobium ferrooxidans TaxID=84205 RepID=UPI0012EA4FD0|nr:hypothetical protein [Chlorobium ferrooxidans]
MKIRLLWMGAVKEAWDSYIRKLNRDIMPQRMDIHLSQQITMGGTLEEFAEMVFIEGFAAGEKHAKSLISSRGKHEPSIN